MTTALPVCPADPDRVVALLEMWSCTKAPTTRWLAARAERIRLLRAAGRIADGERYGWLTLAGFYAGLRGADALGIDPAFPGFEVRCGHHDTLPCPLLGPVPATAAAVPGTNLRTFDWRDPAAARLARATCGAEHSAIVDFDGAPYATGPFLDAVASRLRAASEAGSA